VETRKVLTVEEKIPLLEAARLAGVTRQLIWRRIRAGELSTSPNPRDLRVQLIDRADVEKYFELEADDMRAA
jgi:predicted DNA-binding transcriptional regulator AlpA